MPYYQPTELWKDGEAIHVPSYGAIEKAPCLELVGLVASWLQSNGYIIRYVGDPPLPEPVTAETAASNILVPPYNTGATLPPLNQPPYVTVAGAGAETSELDASAKKGKVKTPGENGGNP